LRSNAYQENEDRKEGDEIMRRRMKIWLSACNAESVTATDTDAQEFLCFWLQSGEKK